MKKTKATPNTQKRIDCFSLFFIAVMAGALLVVVLIGLFSDLGLHPDEWDVKMCLDYGMTHFLPPDMRAPGLGDTYSWYGYTKLDNYTWYFFLAGKVACLPNGCLPRCPITASPTFSFLQQSP